MRVINKRGKKLKNKIQKVEKMEIEHIAMGEFMLISYYGTISYARHYIVDFLKKFPTKKTICFNLSMDELGLNKDGVGNFLETNRFVGSIEMLNTIRDFSQEKDAKFVIINNYRLLESRGRWFFNNLRDISTQCQLVIMLMEAIPASYNKEIPPTIRKLKSKLNLPFKYAEKVYFLLGRPQRPEDEKLQIKVNPYSGIYLYKSRIVHDSELPL